MDPLNLKKNPDQSQAKEYPIGKGIGILLLGVLIDVLLFSMIPALIAAAYVSYDIAKTLRKRVFSSIFLVLVIGYLVNIVANIFYYVIIEPEFAQEMLAVIKESPTYQPGIFSDQHLIIIFYFSMGLIYAIVYTIGSIIGYILGKNARDDRTRDRKERKDYSYYRELGKEQDTTDVNKKYRLANASKKSTPQKITCPNCGLENTGDSKYCIKCGAHIDQLRNNKELAMKETQKCPYCNATIDSEDKDILFCGNCGAKIKKTTNTGSDQSSSDQSDS